MESAGVDKSPQPWPPLAALIPHRPPMLLLDAIERFEPGLIECSVTPRAGGPFVEGDRVPALVSVEYFAQAAAAYFGVVHRHSEVMHMGVLLGARELTLEVDSFPLDATMIARVREVWTDGQVAQFDCELRGVGGARLASASINVKSVPASASLQDGGAPVEAEAEAAEVP